MRHRSEWRLVSLWPHKALNALRVATKQTWRAILKITQIETLTNSPCKGSCEKTPPVKTLGRPLWTDTYLVARHGLPDVLEDEPPHVHELVLKGAREPAGQGPRSLCEATKKTCAQQNKERPGRVRKNLYLEGKRRG